MTFSRLQIGDHMKVLGYHRSDPSYRERLLSMGLTPGATFWVTKIAPLGDPVLIEIRGYTLSLRKKEADILKLQRLDNTQ